MARTDDFEDIFAAMVERVLAKAVADAVKVGIAEGWRQAIAAFDRDQYWAWWKGKEDKVTHLGSFYRELAAEYLSSKAPMG